MLCAVDHRNTHNLEMVVATQNIGALAECGGTLVSVRRGAPASAEHTGMVWTEQSDNNVPLCSNPSGTLLNILFLIVE